MLNILIINKKNKIQMENRLRHAAELVFPQINIVSKHDMNRT